MLSMSWFMKVWLFNLCAFRRLDNEASYLEEWAVVHATAKGRRIDEMPLPLQNN